MTPIEQIRPATPGNWVRRPEGRNKPAEVPRERQRRQQDNNSSGNPPGERPDDPSPHVDELA